MGIVVMAVLLSVPVAHQVIGHNAHRRLLRLVFPCHGPEELPTPHERKHAQRSWPLRLVANAAWMTYLAGSVAVGLALR